MFEKLKDSTKRLYSSILALTLISGSFYMFFTMVIPEYNADQDLRSKKATEEKVLVEYQKALEETNRLKATYSSVEQFKSQLNQFLPVKEELPPIVNQSYGLASLNNVALSGIDFQVKPSEESINKKVLAHPNSKVTITVRATGKYNDLKRYIGDLETNLRLFDLQSINITGGGKKDNPLEASLSFDAYYQPKVVIDNASDAGTPDQSQTQSQ